jgi:hypothetical protein
MTRKDKIAENINDLLPNSSSLLGTDGMEARAQLVQEKASDIHERKTAHEIARARYNIRVEQEAETAKQAVTKFRERKEAAKEQALKDLEDQDDSITAVEAIEIGNEEAAKHGMPQISMASDVARSIMASQGTTRPEVVRLLTQLNVNLNLQLTKTDTANLLACLLTANENQLRAIYKNKKVPVAVKTVIKRLLDDAQLGNIETVEKLWDRIFGKAGMMLNLPEQTQQMTGIIPNTPVSREAYIVIRDTLLK